MLRNNGDGTWQPHETFAGVTARAASRGQTSIGDADPDAVFVDAAGALHVLHQPAGRPVRGRQPAIAGRLAGVVAATVADLDADGALDIVTLESNGDRSQGAPGRSAMWTSRRDCVVAGLSGARAGAAGQLLVADLDNNGALDLVASRRPESRVWLADERLQLDRADRVACGAGLRRRATSNADGRLDLLASPTGRPVVALGRGDDGVSLEDRFGRGRRRLPAISASTRSASAARSRSEPGLLVQKQLITGRRSIRPRHAHRRSTSPASSGPTASPQAEFDARRRRAIVAEQRLKGSCPWVFAYDGDAHAVRHRLPVAIAARPAHQRAGHGRRDADRGLGQDRGDQLAPRDGDYDVRITAELWETHFFDHVSLMVVDHPADTEVFVDERFSPSTPPALAVQRADARCGRCARRVTTRAAT